MKKILVLILVLNLNSKIVFSQEKFETPPGTIFLKDNLFIDKTPVTNIMFLEYLTVKDITRKKGFNSFSDFHKSTDEKFDKLIISYPSYLKTLNQKGSFLTKKNYFENTKYEYSPVLRITKEQAMDFCKWRTEMVLYSWANKNKTINYNINYRLPQEGEMNLAKEYFSQRNKFEFYDGKNPTKFKTDKNVNSFIIYNISEFTITENIFGNNWKNNSPTEFPNEITGFRCVCEIQP